MNDVTDINRKRKGLVIFSDEIEEGIRLIMSGARKLKRKEDRIDLLGDVITRLVREVNKS